MRYAAGARSLSDDTLDAIVVPVFTDGTVPAAVLDALGPLAGDVPATAARFAWSKPGASVWLAPGSGAPDLLLLGVGAAGEIDRDALIVAAMAAGRANDRPRVACLLALAAPSEPAAGTIVAENWVIGSYRFDRYRSGDHPVRPEEVWFWGTAAADVELGVVLGEAANRTRDLVNTPAGDLTPLMMAEHCRELGASYGFTVSVIRGQDLVDGGFGGLLGVGVGSANPPVLIEIERGRTDRPQLALVGKGITFDAGGLSLKTTKEMLTMKADMSGAAAIVSSLVAADRLGLGTRVKAYLACAENMPSGTAGRIGDVLRHRNGLTTEVVDADCEGRLVLGDALAYAAEHAPTHIVDIATLTASTGLGPDLWAGIGTDGTLVHDLLSAGADSGEPGWQLPLWTRYAARLRSDVADLRNHDPSIEYPFGSVLAAQFLRQFVGSVPWAHIDLALTVMRSDDTPIWRSGANGNGTRTLARHLMASDARTERSSHGTGFDAPDRRR